MAQVSDNVAAVQALSLDFGQAVTQLAQSHEAALSELEKLKSQLLFSQAEKVNLEADIRELRRQLATVQGGVPGGAA